MTIDERDGRTDESSTDRTDSASARPADSINRRSCLRLVGAGLVSGVAASTAGAVSGEQYEHVVDIVDDLDADPTGEEPINDALAEAVEYDSVKVVFPDGEYWIENGPGGTGFARWDFGDGEEAERVGDLALVGEGDVTLRPTEEDNYPVLTLWGRTLTIENVRLDQTGHHVSTGMTTVAEDELLVRNVHLDGVADGPAEPVDTPADVAPEAEGPFAIIPGLLDEDGTGLIENFRAPDGCVPYVRKGGCWVNFLHAGDLLFRRCEFSNFSDNGLYGSPPGQGPPLGQDGSVRVENCYFRNNNVTAIRLGSPGSYAKNCTVVVDGDGPPILPWGGLTSRAGWIWYGFDGYYKNIDVVIDHPSGEGFFTYPIFDGSLDLRNCRVEANADGTHAVRATDGAGPVTIENLSVTGEAGDSAAVNLANRECTVRNLCLTQTGAERDGVSLSNVTGTITNPSIDVTGEAIVEEGSDVVVRNLREDGNCPPAQRHHSPKWD